MNKDRKREPTNNLNARLTEITYSKGLYRLIDEFYFASFLCRFGKDDGASSQPKITRERAALSPLPNRRENKASRLWKVLAQKLQQTLSIMHYKPLSTLVLRLYTHTDL